MSTTIAVPLNTSQRKVITIAYVVYGAFYLGRVNLSAALPDMETSLQLSKESLGLLSTGYFWTYALGTLINGRLGDLISPRRLVFIGMFTAALFNLAFGFSSTFLLLLLFWSLNGLFQSMGWGPTLRLLSNWLDPDQRRRVSGLFASSFVVGNALTWLLTGWLVARFSWRAAFWLPATLMLLMATVWYSTIRDNPAQDFPKEDTNAPTIRLLLVGMWQNFRQFWPLVLASICLGFCMVGLIIWAPAYFVEVAAVDIATSSTVATLIPIAGILGTLLMSWFIARYQKSNEAYTLAIFLVILAGLFFLHQTLPITLSLLVASLMLIGGLAYGVTSLLLSVLPLTLSNPSEASGTAGLLDFSVNIGGGLSGWSIGAILENGKWETVFLILSVLALCSAVFVFYQGYLVKRVVM